ncbi:MAG: hypothetical protein ABSE95_05345 [Thermodesulfobacteriota bacterium]
MKKIISLLSILFVLTLFVPPKQAEAFRGSGGSRGPGGQGGYSGSGGPGEYRGPDRYHSHGGYGRYGGFFPGLIIGGVVGWALWPGYYYPPSYDYPPPPEGNQAPPSASQGSDSRMFIYPRQGQSEEKQAKDFDECHIWAVSQTGFDPKKPFEGAPDAQRIQKSADYLRAICACLDAHGYTLR